MKEKRQKQAISWPAFFDPYYYGYLIHRGLLPPTAAHTPSGMTASTSSLNFAQLASSHAPHLLGGGPTPGQPTTPAQLISPGMALLQPAYNLLNSPPAANQLSSLATFANFAGVPKIDFPSNPSGLSYTSSPNPLALHSSHSTLKTTLSESDKIAVLPTSKNAELESPGNVGGPKNSKLESSLTNGPSFLSTVLNKDLLKHSLKEVTSSIACSTQ